MEITKIAILALISSIREATKRREGKKEWERMVNHGAVDVREWRKKYS